MHQSIVFCSACTMSRKDSSRSLSHLLMSFLLTPPPTQHQSLRSLLVSGDKGDRTETSTHCAPWSQFVVSNIFSVKLQQFETKLREKRHLANRHINNFVGCPPRAFSRVSVTGRIINCFFLRTLEFIVTIRSNCHLLLLCAYQWLLVWMLSWRSRQLTMSDKLKIESCHSGERFLPMRNTSCVTESMRSFVPWACRRDWLWWNEPTALLCTSSVWHCQHSWVCVINGTVNNSQTLSSHSLLSSQLPLKQSVSRDSLGRCLITNDVASSSVLYNKVSKRSKQAYIID